MTGLEERDWWGGVGISCGTRIRNALSVKAAGAKSSRPTIVKSVNYECVCVRLCACVCGDERPEERPVGIESA